MGKGSDPAPPPAPDPAIAIAAQGNVELGNKWLEFSQQQYAGGLQRQAATDALTKQVIDAQLAQQGKQNEYQDKMLGYQDQQFALQKDAQTKAQGYQDKMFAQQDDQYKRAVAQDEYNKATFRPVEGKMVDEAMTFDSPERQNDQAAQAKADVMDGAARAKDTTERSQMAMGVNPASGRFAGITAAGDMQAALAGAGAQNSARNRVRDMGIMLRKDAANYSKGISSTAAQSYGIASQAGAQGVSAVTPGSYAQQGMAAGNMAQGAAQTGMSAGGSALGANQSSNSNYFQTGGVMGSGFSGAMNGNSSAAGIYQNQYNGQLNAWDAQNKANQAQSNGFGNLLGTAAKIGMAFI